jgi:hypothetical protein
VASYYPPTTDITHLTSVIVDHARYVAKLAHRALSASVTSPSASFNSVNAAADASIASPSIATVLAAASRVRGYKHLMLTAALVWRRLTLRHKQNVSVMRTRAQTSQEDLLLLTFFVI